MQNAWGWVCHFSAYLSRWLFCWVRPMTPGFLSVDACNPLFAQPLSALTWEHLNTVIFLILRITQRTLLLLSNVFERCETEMRVTHSSLSGVIKQLCEWKTRPVGPSPITEWSYGIMGFYLEKSSSTKLSPQGVPSLGWQDTSNAASLHRPEEIKAWVLAFHKL